MVENVVYLFLSECLNCFLSRLLSLVSGLPVVKRPSRTNQTYFVWFVFLTSIHCIEDCIISQEIPQRKANGRASLPEDLPGIYKEKRKSHLVWCLNSVPLPQHFLEAIWSLQVSQWHCYCPCLPCKHTKLDIDKVKVVLSFAIEVPFDVEDLDISCTSPLRWPSPSMSSSQLIFRSASKRRRTFFKSIESKRRKKARASWRKYPDAQPLQFQELELIPLPHFLALQPLNIHPKPNKKFLKVSRKSQEEWPIKDRFSIRTGLSKPGAGQTNLFQIYFQAIQINYWTSKCSVIVLKTWPALGLPGPLLDAQTILPDLGQEDQTCIPLMR